MTLYKRLDRQRRKISQFYKVDLHVHTVASKDYIRAHSQTSDEEEYVLLLDKIANSDVDIVAITDHNSSKGFYEIQSIIQSGRGDQNYKSKLQGKLLLPGVEITCYNKHFLAIFPEDFAQDKLDLFLIECGILKDEQGKESASADRVTPLTLCEKIETYSGITMIAHCDAENGLLQHFFGQKDIEADIQGNSLKKILKSKSVCGICYNSISNIPRLNELKSTWRLNLPLIQASDSHSSLDDYVGSGLPLGTRCSWVKLGEASFRSLRLAMKNGDSRIENAEPRLPQNPILLGIAVRGGFIRSSDSTQNWAVIPLADQLNCLIGGRGSGKSTLIEILKFVLTPVPERAFRAEIIQRFDEAIVYFRDVSVIHAIYMRPDIRSLRKQDFIYREDKFVRVREAASSIKSITSNLPITGFEATLNIFRQKELLDLAREELGPTAVIESLCLLKYGNQFADILLEQSKRSKNIVEQAKQLLHDRRKDKQALLTSDYLEKEYEGYINAHQKLCALRKDVIKELNKVVSGRLELAVNYSISQRLYQEVIRKWIWKIRERDFIIYEYDQDCQRLLKNLFTHVNNYWSLPFYIFTGNWRELMNHHKLDEKTAQLLTKTLNDLLEPEDLLILPQLVVDFSLNTNHGLSKKETFVKRSRLSYGQKAVGMLLLVLHGATELGENRPLIIDQPEDDLDNHYIYSTLVKEFQHLKQRRQLIMATHNPNIPVGGDAENILVFLSDGINGWINNLGGIDRRNISKELLRILEGDEEAFNKRKFTYDLI